MVLLSSVMVPVFRMPPVLLTMELLSSVAVPVLEMPPPLEPPALPKTTLSLSVNVPRLKMPPPVLNRKFTPFKEGAEPRAMVKPDKLAVPLTSISNTRLLALPSMANSLAPGPVRVTSVEINSCVPPSVIIAAPPLVRLDANVIVLEFASALAKRMASRNERSLRLDVSASSSSSSVVTTKLSGAAA